MAKPTIRLYEEGHKCSGLHCTWLDHVPTAWWSDTQSTVEMAKESTVARESTAFIQASGAWALYAKATTATEYEHLVRSELCSARIRGKTIFQ